MEESFTLVLCSSIFSQSSHSSFARIAFLFAAMDFHSKTSMTAPSTDFIRNEASEMPPSDLSRGACFLIRDRNFRSDPAFAL